MRLAFKLPKTDRELLDIVNEVTHKTLVKEQIIFFTALCDKGGFTKEFIAKIWRESERLSDSISQGRVNYHDLAKVLKNEYDIEVDIYG